jgi:hypothetical protein
MVNNSDVISTAKKTHLKLELREEFSGGEVVGHPAEQTVAVVPAFHGQQTTTK